MVDKDGAQLTELQGSTPVHTNIFADGKLLATYASSQTYFEFFDWLGTKRAEIGTSCTSTYANLAYGDNLTPNGNCIDATEHHYTTKEHDVESGNDFFFARYYSSIAARFLGPDSSGLFFAAPENPQSLNLYGYVYNNPVNSIDTDGQLTIVIPGTYWKPSDWNYQNPLVNEAARYFNEQHKTWLDQWDPRRDRDADRLNAAKGLADFINNYQFAPGEGLYIVAHSHGGNIALTAAALGLKHKIDTLITLGTPFGYASISPEVGKWYNITGSGDDVQPFASKNCPTAGCDIQQGAINFTVQAGSHSALWDNSSVRKLWWDWITQQEPPQRTRTTPCPNQGAGGIPLC